MTTVVEEVSLREVGEGSDVSMKRRIAIMRPQELAAKAFEPLDRIVDSGKAQTALALGLAAGQCFELQAKGHTKTMPGVIRHTLESGAHPVLGFVGAWLGYVAAKRLIQRGESREREWVDKKSLRTLAIGSIAVIGVIAADLGTETLQGIHAGAIFDYWHHMKETSKDAAAAAAGALEFAREHLRERRQAWQHSEDEKLSFGQRVKKRIVRVES